MLDYAWELWLDYVSPRLVGQLLSAIALFLLTFGFAAGAWLKRQRGQAFLDQLAAGHPGALHVEKGPNRRGMSLRLQPAPPPFDNLSLHHQAMSLWDPLDLTARLVRGQQDRLVIRGRLGELPTAELEWERGRIPARALGSMPGTGLWTRRHLDIGGDEYVTRGANTGGLQHSLIDLQKRYGPHLRRVAALSDQIEQVEIMFDSARLDPEQLPAIIHIARALGRAAMRS